MILLDTCTLLWLTSDPSQLSKKAQEKIRENNDSLFVSSISAFEIAIKVKKKKLILPMKINHWFEETLDFHGIEEISIDSSLLIRAAELPPHHQDPCDRIMIATAESHRLILLTPDSLIKQYHEAKTEW